MEDRPSAIIRLSGDMALGDSRAAAALFPLIYDELRTLAAGLLRGERRGHTLQPTALVNEAFLKIVRGRPADWNGRQHFQAVAALAMRQILVNHARDRGAQKRGGADRRRVTLSEAIEPSAASRDVDLLALDDALAELATLDPQQAKIVEMRYFAGMTNEQIAGVLGISERTITRDWRMACAWLASRMREAERGGSEADG